MHMVQPVTMTFSLLRHCHQLKLFARFGHSALAAKQAFDKFQLQHFHSIPSHPVSVIKFKSFNEGCTIQACSAVHTSAAQLGMAKQLSLALQDSVKQVSHTPKVALLLSAAGLVPFWAPSYLIFTSGTFLPHLLLYQTYYGATMLSFLGGARWGLTLPPSSSQSPDLTNLGYGALIQLWAFSSLVTAAHLEYPVVGSLSVALGLAVTGYMDVTMTGYPAWYKGLRLLLTVAAVLSMFICLVCKAIFSENKEEEKQRV